MNITYVAAPALLMKEKVTSILSTKVLNTRSIGLFQHKNNAIAERNVQVCFSFHRYQVNNIIQNIHLTKTQVHRVTRAMISMQKFYILLRNKCNILLLAQSPPFIHHELHVVTLARLDTTMT